MELGNSESFYDSLNSLHSIIPEVILVLTILLLLGNEILFSKSKKIIKENISFTLSTLIMLAGVITTLFFELRTRSMLSSDLYFSGWIILSNLNHSIRILMDIGAILCIILSYGYEPFRSTETKRAHSEYYIMMAGILLAAHFWVLSNHWLLSYACIEMISLGGYFLTIYRKEHPFAAEVGVKYLIYGSFASALMLFGVSIHYLVTGGIFLNDISTIASSIPTETALIIYSLWWVGVAFKIAALPFHFWAPEVYMVAPTPSVAFLATIPKLAAAYFIIIIFEGGNKVITLPMITLLAITTMTVGNIAAFAQKDIKRMLAFSGIGQAGYFLCFALIIAGGGEKNVKFSNTFLFMTGIYMLGSILCFAIIQLWEKTLGNNFLSDDKKWNGQAFGTLKYSGILVLMLAVGFLSLIGFPPTAGFFAKFFLLTEIFNSKSAEPYRLIIAVALILNTVLSLFYYSRPLIILTQKTNSYTLEDTSKWTTVQKAIIALTAVLALLLFIFSIIPGLN